MGNEDWREERGEAAGREDGEASRGPNKISAATKYSFTGKNLTAYGGLLPVAAMLEKLEFQQLVGEFGESESETDAESKGAQRISTRHDPGCLCWILPAEPLAVSGTRADAAGDIAGGASPCKARFEVERQLGRLNARLRERVWAAAPVRLSTLQPQEQRQAERSADADVHRGDARVCGRTVAQWRQAERRGYRIASGTSDRDLAQHRGNGAGQSGCGLLLLGGGEGVYAPEMRVCDRCPENGTATK